MRKQDLNDLIKSTEALVECANGPYSLKKDIKDEFFLNLTCALKLGKNKTWKKFLYDQLGDSAFTIAGYTLIEKLNLNGNYITYLDNPTLNEKDIALAIDKGVNIKTLMRLKYKFNNFTLFKASQHVKHTYQWLSKTSGLFRYRDKCNLVGKDARDFVKLIHDLTEDFNHRTKELRKIVSCFVISDEQKRLCECYIMAVDAWNDVLDETSMNLHGNEAFIARCFVDETYEYYINIFDDPDKQRDAFTALTLQSNRLDDGTTFKSFFDTIDKLIAITK